MLRRPFILAATLLAVMALAQTPAHATGIETAPTFGKANCTPVFPCATVTSHDADRTFISELVENTNKCVAARLVLTDPEGYFVESYGLDSSLCLKTKKMPTPTSGLVMTPKCCIVPTSKNPDMCQVTCTKYGIK